MLVLGRDSGDDVLIHVGDVEILVRVVESRAGRTRLGFEAPPHVQINRREIAEEKAARGELNKGKIFEGRR